MEVLESLVRWLHVVAGALFLGAGLFLNVVLARALPSWSEESQRAILPDLLPRAFGFLRASSLLVWATGFVFLMPMVYYHSRLHLEPTTRTTPGSLLLIAVAYLGFGVYDPLFARVRNGVAQLVLALLLIAAYGEGLVAAGFSYRGQAIHLGVLLGTVMVANVSMRIWPGHRKALAARANGEAPDVARLWLAADRARHNAYLALPVVFLMLAQHGTWLAGLRFGLTLLVALGFALCALFLRPTGPR